jgi:hypothetical protein
MYASSPRVDSPCFGRTLSKAAATAGHAAFSHDRLRHSPPEDCPVKTLDLARPPRTVRAGPPTQNSPNQHTALAASVMELRLFPFAILASTDSKL